jgi:hypothetical protein
MAESDIVIPSDVNKIITERVTLWERFDKSQSEINEMNSKNEPIAVSTPAQIPGELSTEKTPPAEIAAAYQLFQAELAKIGQFQNTIKEYQSEIKKIEDQQKLIITIAVIGAIILVVVVACLGISLLSSLSH